MGQADTISSADTATTTDPAVMDRKLKCASSLKVSTVKHSVSDIKKYIFIFIII